MYFRIIHFKFLQEYGTDIIYYMGVVGDISYQYMDAIYPKSTLYQGFLPETYADRQKPKPTQIGKSKAPIHSIMN